MGGLNVRRGKLCTSIAQLIRCSTLPDLPGIILTLAAIMHNVMGFHTCVEQTRANSDQLIGVM
jgi:hypothetical protein